MKKLGNRLPRLAAAVVFALAGIPAASPTAAWAQSWNMYGSGGSFFVPITSAPNPNGGPPELLVSLTLNGGNNTTLTNNFILDTGSLGLVADPAHYRPGNDPILAPYATITYTTSGDNPVGSLYLTNVQINGTNGQSVIARVPILGSTNYGYKQLGVGFDRGGISIGQSATSPLTPANNYYNMNPFLALVSGPGVSTMQPGYIIGMNGFQNLGLGPGVLLGLNSQNTSGFSFQQLASNGGLPSYCGTAGMGCPLQWSAQNGSISITTNGHTYNLGSASQLPDSGISYMIVNAPGNTVPVGPGNCSDSGSPTNCLQSGTVQVFLPGQNQAAYSFTLGDATNPSTPFGVQVSTGVPPSNLGRTFFENLNYLYDPINGFVGYEASGTSGTNAVIIPMVALQGNLALSNGFLSSFPMFLMGGLTLQQSGSGILNGPITGPGGLTLLSGNVTLGGVDSYSGGTTVNGGWLTIANTGSIVGDVTINKGGGFTNNGTIDGNGLLTVNAGGSFINNGTVNTPLQWQLNQGSFTNNGTFNGSLANTGTASNTGTLTGSVINGTSGMFSNSGTITGGVSNMGLFANTGTIGGNVTNMGLFANNGTVSGGFTNTGILSGNGILAGGLINSGVVAPGNSIGTLNVNGSFVQNPTGSYQVQTNGAGQSDLISVTGAPGTATLNGGPVNVVGATGVYAPRTTYSILSATGGVTGTYSGVTSAYPFLQPSLSYGANNVYLTLQIGGFAAAAQTPTQRAVGAVLDATAPSASGDFATVLGSVATASSLQGQGFMTAISGQNYAGFSTALVQNAQLFMTNFANQAGGGTTGGGSRVALAEACDIACDTSAPLWGAWGGGIGGTGTVGASAGTGTVTYTVGGFAAGIDRLVTPSVRAGVAVGYSNGSQWVGGFSGSGLSNTVQAALYGNYSEGAVYLDGLAGYAYSANQMWRTIVVPNLNTRTAQGQTGANQVFGQLEGGYRVDVLQRAQAEAYVTPFARLQAYTGTQNGFTETGAQSLNLTVGSQTTNSLRSVLGAQLGGAMDVGLREKLGLQFKLGWSHEYANTTRPVAATLAGAPGMSFTTYGVSPQRDGVLVGLSGSTAVAEATSVYLRYEGNLSGQDSTHAFTAGLRMTW